MGIFGFGYMFEIKLQTCCYVFHALMCYDISTITSSGHYKPKGKVTL